MMKVRSTLDRIPFDKTGRTRVPGPLGPSMVVAWANESPYPPLASVQQVIREATATANRYPDDGATDLRSMLAVHHRVDERHVSVGCGATELCLQAALTMLEPGTEAVYPWPSFGLFPIIIALTGADERRVPLRDDRLDLEAMLGAIGPRTRLVILCNPNNPTGTALEHGAVRAFLASVPGSCLVLLDEAYREFAGGRCADGPALLSEHPNLLVVRTFSKAHALAGLRVGYGLAAPGVLKSLVKTHLPYTVSSLGLVAAAASLGAVQELAERVSSLTSERSRLTQGLHALGYDVVPSDANFVWVPSAAGAIPLAQAARDLGVLIFPVRDHGVRITVGMPRHNDAIIAALSAVIAKLP